MSRWFVNDQGTVRSGWKVFGFYLLLTALILVAALGLYKLGRPHIIGPWLGTDGYAGWKAVFDEWGHQTEQTYFGVDGEPCLTKGEHGLARWKVMFDEHGNRAEMLSMGTSGEVLFNIRYLANGEVENINPQNP